MKSETREGGREGGEEGVPHFALFHPLTPIEVFIRSVERAPLYSWNGHRAGQGVNETDRMNGVRWSKSLL